MICEQASDSIHVLRPLLIIRLSSSRIFLPSSEDHKYLDIL